MVCKELSKDTKSKEYRLKDAARERAKAKGLKFNLETIDVVIPKRCPILGMKLRPNVNGKGQINSSPTLDRRRTKHYVRGNIWVISSLANVMKNCATKSQLIRFAKWVITTYMTKATAEAMISQAKFEAEQDRSA